MKVFFIGDPLLISGYRMSGVQVMPVHSGAELVAAIESVLKMQDVGVVLVDHDYSSQVKDKVDQIKTKYSMPVLVEVPGRKTSATVDMKATVSRVMGLKI